MDTEDFKNKLSQIKEANDKIFGSLLKDTEIYKNVVCASKSIFFGRWQ